MALAVLQPSGLRREASQRRGAELLTPCPAQAIRASSVLWKDFIRTCSNRTRGDGLH